MESLPTPVLDDHLHLHPDGDGIEAAKTFARAGGTHLLVVNRPSWHLVESVDDVDAFRETFEQTIELVEGSTEVLPGRAWPVLGVHPVLLPRLVADHGWSVDDAAQLMRDGLELAADLVAGGRALALKSGRPHFDVSESVLRASNDLIQHVFALAAEVDCAVQLHTEDTDDGTEFAELANEVGLEPHRVVKHYASGPVKGITPSVIARSVAVRAVRNRGDPFMLETDFLDDPTRPGAVLGPKVVPRRSKELAESGHHAALEVAHVETPGLVYGIDTRATLE